MFNKLFGRGEKRLKVALYTRVSTIDQRTLPAQTQALKNYAEFRKWEIIAQVEEVASGAKKRPKREALLQSARKREIDLILVWRLDRWGRSVADLISTLEKLKILGVGFISITEALDLKTPTGRSMAGLLAVFAEFEREVLRERIKAGVEYARKKGKKIGRPRTAARKTEEIKRLFLQGLSKSEIARRLKIGRTSVIRLLSV